MADDDTTPDPPPPAPATPTTPPVPTSPTVGPLGPGWMDPKMLQPAQPATPPTPKDPIMEEFDRREGEIKSLIEASNKEQQPFYDAALKALQRPSPSYPRMQPTPEPPKPEDYQKGAVRYASSMAVLGALGTAFFHVPAGAALKAFAGAVDGFHKGNLEAYELHSKEWEQQSRRAIEYNKNLLNQYNAAMSNRQHTIDSAMAEVQLIAAKNHDMIAYRMASEKNYTGIAEYLAKAGRYTDEMTTTTDDLWNNHKAGVETIKATIENNYPPVDSPEFADFYNSKSEQDRKNIDAAYRMAGQPGGTVQGWTPDMIRNGGHYLNLTGMMPPGVPKSRSGVSPLATALTRSADQQLKDEGVEDPVTQRLFNAQTYKAHQAALSGWWREGGKSVQSMNAALQHLEALKATFLQLQNSDNRVANEAKLRWQTLTGKAPPVKMELQAQIVADEVVKAVVPGGGGVGEREAMNKHFSGASSISQYLDGIDAGARELMVGQVRALRQRYTSATGAPEAYFDLQLLPKTREFLHESDQELEPGVPGVPGAQPQHDPAGIL